MSPLRGVGWAPHDDIGLFAVCSGRNMIMTPENHHDDPFKKATTTNLSARLLPRPDHKQDTEVPPKFVLDALGSQTTNTARRDPSCERYWKPASSAHSSTGQFLEYPPQTPMRRVSYLGELIGGASQADRPTHPLQIPVQRVSFLGKLPGQHPRSYNDRHGNVRVSAVQATHSAIRRIYSCKRSGFSIHACQTMKQLVGRHPPT